MLSTLHPTKQTLIKSAVKFLESSKPEEITSEQILADSGISKGSLYHHFVDFPELIEQAQVYMFSRYVGVSVDAINSVLTSVSDRESMITGLKSVTRSTQSVELKQVRNSRLNAIAKSIRIERMRNLLGLEQERLTGALADLFRECQERGWGNPNLDPVAVAIFIQAYTIGRVVDDLAPEHMDEESWFRLIDKVIETVFLPPVAKKPA